MIETSHLALILPAFLLAGFVKGVIGLGLPSVAVALLALAVAPAQAAALLIMPSLVTNVWQMAAGPSLGALVRRLWPMLAAICLGTLATASLLASNASGLATFGLGISLSAYALLGILGRPLVAPPGHEWWLSPTMGGLTGMITGVTGTFVIPVVPFVQSIGLAKDDLIQALGLCFTVSTIALAAALWHFGTLDAPVAGTSLFAVLPAVAGMAAGQWLRDRVSTHVFRHCFFAGMLLVGGHLATKGLGL